MDRFIKYATKQAELSSYGYRLGAVVLSGKRIVSKGYNKLKTNPKLFKEYGYYSTHAECSALMRAAGGDTLVVVRIKKNGDLACSKPCEKCQRFIKDYGIKRVFYIDWDSEVKEMQI